MGMIICVKMCIKMSTVSFTVIHEYSNTVIHEHLTRSFFPTFSLALFQHHVQHHFQHHFTVILPSNNHFLPSIYPHFYLHTIFIGTFTGTYRDIYKDIFSTTNGANFKRQFKRHLQRHLGDIAVSVFFSLVKIPRYLLSLVWVGLYICPIN